MTFLESYLGEQVGIVSLVDEFAQDRGTRGPMPLPIPPLRFSLIAREEQNVMTPLDPHVELRAQSGPTGAYLFADEGHHGDEPPFRITPGRYRLRIESDYYQRLDEDLDWPAPDTTLLLLRPGAAYPFPSVTVPSARLTLLRGSVLSGAAGEPVEGATVEILNPPNLGAFATAITDARGAWVLAFRRDNPAPFNATVRITIGNDQADVPNVAIVPGSDNSLSHTALRGTVLSTAGNAIRDAEITVDLVANAVVRSDRNGRWAFYFDLGQQNAAAQVTALAPNGESESQNVQIENRKTIVVPTFRIAMN